MSSEHGQRLGDATIAPLSAGRLLWTAKFAVNAQTWRDEVPETDAQGRIPLGLYSAYVAVSGAHILIDPMWWPPDGAAEWPALVAIEDGLFTGLAAFGLAPSDVTHVLITHGHHDHLSGISIDGSMRFPNATHYLQRADWIDNPARLDPQSRLNRYLHPVIEAEMLQLVDGDVEVVAGVTMLHTGGESEGHAVIHVESAGRSFMYLGDLLHHPCEVEHPDWILEGRDLGQLLHWRSVLFEQAAREAAVVTFSHSLSPSGGIVRSSDTGFRWQPSERSTTGT